jgi:molybdopterin converting factor small subunit
VSGEGELGAISVRLRCFSHVRQAFGAVEVTLSLPAGATAADLEREVRARLPDELGSLALRVAINQEIVEDAAPLHDGDEVAVLPPVQGG